MSLLVPNQISYNETISIRKDGSFDAQALRRAFHEVVRRHAVWRTTFDTVGGEPVQVVHPAPDFDLPVLDLSHLSRDQAESQAVHLVAGMSRVPYDVRRGPLLRPRLIRFASDHHRLYLALHHLVFDAVSVNRVVLPELVALYDAFCAGRPSPLPEPRAQYADYARWEREWIGTPRVARRLEYWRRHLDSSPLLSLPLDHARPAARRFRGGVIPLSVPNDVVDRLRGIARSNRATLFQVLATVWSLLLSRYSGQRDVVFAAAADLRQRPELESAIGYFVTPLVMRIDLSDEPHISDLVVRVRNELLDGLDHLVPFERLVRELRPDGGANANPIYQTMLVLEPPAVTPDRSWSVHTIESEIGDAVGGSRLDLELQLDERPDGRLAGRLIYDRDLLSTATAAKMAEHWSQLAAGVGADPHSIASRIPILTAAQAHRQLVEWNATATDRPPGVVHELVRGRSERQPEAPAVSAGGQDVSYSELNRRSDRLVHRLRRADVKPGDVVALCSAPSIDLIVGLLGVLKAGAAYLLLDPELPTKQRDVMVTECGVATVLTQRVFADARPASPGRLLILGEPEHDDPAEPAISAHVVPDAVCCVQYTTRPVGGLHGVRVRHASVANLATALSVELGVGPTSTVLTLPSTFFEVSVMELWLPLMAGARMIVAPADVASDGARLSRLIAAERVTFLHAPPVTWQRLIDTGLKPSRSLRALSGGQPLSPELADQILQRCRVLWNAYGAVETTAHCTLARVEPSTPVTIGRPIANTQVYVLDRYSQPVPVGVTGNLLVAGDGVASGYLNRADLTTAAFVDNPFRQGRAFRTGDLARWRADGELEFGL